MFQRISRQVGWIGFAMILCLPAEARMNSVWFNAAATLSVPAPTGVPGTFDFKPQIALPGGGFGFELGRFVFDFQYLPKAFYDGFNEMRFNVVQTSSMFRFWLGGRRRKIVGIGLGGYFSYGLSVTRDGAEYDYASYGLKNTDVGAVVGVAVQLPWAFFIEARAAYSILNSATAAGQTWRNLDFMVLSGLRFGGSGRR